MKTSERLDRHDRQVAAIRALVQEGMRLVVETRREFEPFTNQTNFVWDTAKWLWERNS